MASIQKRPNGTWRARYRDANGKEHARHFPRKIDGQRWLDGVTATLVVGTYVDPAAGRITLASYFAEWSTRQVWARGTATAMSLAVRRCTFADVELGKLRRSHVETWIKSMSAEGLAAGTIRTRTNNVRAVLRGALRDRLIGSDPSEGVTLPRGRKAEHAMRVPSPEEVGAVLDSAEEWFRPFVALCAFAGLRLGEAAGAQVSDVDFLRRQLHVQRQVQRVSAGVVEITPPKYGSERVVYLPDELVLLLGRHVEQVGVRGDEGWLFVGGGGQPPHQNTVGYWWRSTVARAGVDAFRLHDLRHFYASGLIADGCDVVTVQRALGHAKATTTLETYSHLWPTAEDRTRAAAGRLMATSLSNRTAAGSLAFPSP
ncbi:tyrosine-type recombinase/integrase [Rathayibacter sp. AY1C5]|uniref:tyrosine-type recombinase/integrase n=1 Tax=Rathayibacter sp. AY1C5 TaxID=2080538 RepID=UPI000CE82ED4|nr:tyrosine-type recombinase/integrase [Rathayibacter sp. AY1C5]PPG61630.1 site-specific integrase [Rathayibacter sp. AY1C5]